jgi:hypothetical protein
MTRLRAGIYTWAAGGALAAAACSGDELVRSSADTEITPELVVSEPILRGSPAGDSLSYVSFPAGTVPHGSGAEVTNVRTGTSANAGLVDGALDPVAIPAGTGDTMAVVARDSAGHTRQMLNMVARRRPSVVRSSPGSGASDVPMLSIISIVFSEPMNLGTLTGNVHLVLNGNPVPGRLSVGNDGITAVFEPDVPLSRRSNYRVVVSTGAEDLSGDSLAKGYDAEFRTGDPAPSDTTRFSMVSAGESHTCAVTTSGKLYCWGLNQDKQVANTQRSIISEPTALVLPGTVISVQSGQEHTCALVDASTPAGGVICWGMFVVPDPELSPFPTIDSRPVTQIGSGATHVCGLLRSGIAECTGQIPWLQRSTLYLGGWALVSAVQFATIAGGWSHDCAISQDGRAWCRGLNKSGELGDGTYVPRVDFDSMGVMAFTPVTGQLRFSEITAGWQHTCGVADDKIYCWGDNSRGELGIGSYDANHNIPAEVPAPFRLTAVDAGDHHTCALAADGTSYCWGDNRWGELGDGSLDGRATPVAGASGLKFRSLSAGGNHTCGIANDQALYCWGRNATGQLGDGSTTDSPLPVLVVVNP